MDAVNHIELTIPYGQVRTVLRALLLAIFFHRSLDAVEPDTVELLDSHISCAPSQAIERDITAKIEEFAEEYLDRKGGKGSGEIAVVLLQKRPKRGWFAITEELVPWEEHLITIHFARQQSATTPRHGPNTLNTALMDILQFCVEKKGNVPPLVGLNEQNNLTYQILISPPSPAELFAPASPPTHPTRLTSPPPAPLTSTTTATATIPISGAGGATAYSSRPSPAYTSDTSPQRDRERRANVTPASPASGTMGYLEQAKDGLRAVGAKAGAGVGWGGRAVGAAFGRG